MSIIEVRASHFDGRGSKKDFLVHLVMLLIHGSEFLIKGEEEGIEEPSRDWRLAPVLFLRCLLGAGDHCCQL